MTAYLGSIGALAPIACVESLDGEASRPTSYATTLGGVTFAQVGVSAPRSWRLSFSPGTTPDGPAQVQAFLDGEHGLGPWLWVNEWAQVTNVLPPRVAAGEFGWSNSSAGGAVALPDGSLAGRSMSRAAGTPSSYLRGPSGIAQIPVLPGVPVTGSAWVNGIDSAFLVVQWRDATSGLGDVPIAAPAGWSRVPVSATPPAGATHAYLAATGTCQVARPALTWTPALTPYSAGNGADAVLIDRLSYSPALATHDRQFSPVTYSVREVG